MWLLRSAQEGLRVEGYSKSI